MITKTASLLVKEAMDDWIKELIKKDPEFFDKYRQINISNGTAEDVYTAAVEHIKAKHGGTFAGYTAPRSAAQGFKDSTHKGPRFSRNSGTHYRSEAEEAAHRVYNRFNDARQAAWNKYQGGQFSDTYVGRKYNNVRAHFTKHTGSAEKAFNDAYSAFQKAYTENPGARRQAYRTFKESANKAATGLGLPKINIFTEHPQIARAAMTAGLLGGAGYLAYKQMAD